MSRIASVIRSLSVVSVLVGTAPSALPESPAEATAAAPVAPAANTVPATFQELAAGVGLSYARPAGFQDIPVEINSLWPYEHAVIEPSSDVEIRYAVRPIERMEIAYDDPHSNAPDPYTIYLFDDYERARPIINATLNSLKFLP